VTKLFTGRHARAVSTQLTDTLAEQDLEATNALPFFPFTPERLAPLRAVAERAGQDGFTPMLCGANRALLLRPDGGQWTAREVVQRLCPPAPDASHAGSSS
jgi:hypothetical protein